LLKYCFFDYYKTAIIQHKSIKEFDNKLIEIFESFFNISSLESKFEINYILNDSNNSLKLKICIKDNEVNISFGKKWRDKYDRYISEVNTGISNRNRTCDDIWKDIPVKKQIFIPAGRANIAMFQNQMWKVVKSGVKLDPFLIDWGDFYQEEIKEKIVFNENLFTDDNKKDIMEIIKGEHKRINGIEYLKQGKRNTPLGYSRSNFYSRIIIITLFKRC
jgi:hypothetical protein